MYNLDNVVRMYFSCVPADRIVRGEIAYYDFPAQEFAQLSMDYMPQYSDTENRQLYSYIKDSGKQEGHPFAGMDNRSGLNVFAALEELAEQLLILEEDEVLCIYGNLLRLREITQYVEEDLLVCAYLAVCYKRFGKKHTDFSWNATIGHNNIQLNRIMGRGISENHFHLYGSAPAFQLMWVHFMNHADDRNIFTFSREVDQRQRVTRKHYNKNYREDSMAADILKAALMRACMVRYLLWKDGRDRFRIEEFLREEEESGINDMVSGNREIRGGRFEIQNVIDCLRNAAVLLGMGEVLDYALVQVENLKDANVERYYFAGERWLEYGMLKGELSGDAQKGDAGKYYQWFYAYLLLKQNFRSEVVQTNDKVGFENFAIYSDRKSAYYDKSRLAETAVYGSVGKGNIQSLEVRISPRDQAFDNAAMIWNIDAMLQEREKPFPKSRYYFVFHFSKKADAVPKEREYFSGCYCRHYKKRKELEKQAYAISALRDYYRKAASRVLGIDACAQEIGCRPEVFAPVFRRLSNHVVEPVVGMEQVEVRQMKMTYHVGEDFLDVVDGLRAVDEAVRFLNLRCGDRIGHGTVLGLDARKWYGFKQHTIVLSRQDYLDNVVWLYHKLTEYRLDGFDSLREELERLYAKYFAEIYLHLEDGTVREWRDSNSLVYTDIHAYYEAWKLRGDEPILYQGGKYDKSRIHGRDWFVNRRYPEQAEIRMRDEISYLFYLYHYDWDVRRNGEKSIQVYIIPMYVEGVYAVQKAMQREFASLGIGIESNPSSNLAISVIGGYDEHPIVAMFNKNLTWDVEQIRDCPQMYVSINTDDKGVFHTSLENEYALMACAMEKKKDAGGMPLYNRQMVYQWIDNIREMGNLQSFMEKDT